MPGGGCPQRRGLRGHHLRIRPGWHRHLTRPRHPGRGRHQRRYCPCLRCHDADARHLSRTSGHRSRLRSQDHHCPTARPRPKILDHPRRPRRPVRPAPPLPRSALPLPDHRRELTARSLADHRPRPRRNADGTTTRTAPSRGPAVPPRIHPHDPREPDHPQLCLYRPQPDPGNQAHGFKDRRAINPAVRATQFDWGRSRR